LHRHRLRRGPADRAARPARRRRPRTRGGRRDRPGGARGVDEPADLGLVGLAGRDLRVSADRGAGPTGPGAAYGGGMRRTLLLTNDFPPRPGGIQSFLHTLSLRLPAEALMVYAPRWRGDSHLRFDAAQPYPVVRHPTTLMLPTPAVA